MVEVVPKSLIAEEKFGLPLLEENCLVETQKLNDRIDRYLIEFMLEKSDRLGKEDVEE